MTVGCWPEDPVEPVEVPVEIVDLDGVYVATELDCTMVTSAIGDFADSEYYEMSTEERGRSA